MPRIDARGGFAPSLDGWYGSDAGYAALAASQTIAQAQRLWGQAPWILWRLSFAAAIRFGRCSGKTFVEWRSIPASGTLH